MTINEKIILLRKSNGLTQQELGNKLNITDKAVSKRESQSGSPDIEQIQSLSEIFNISLDYLMKDIAMTNGDREASKKIEEYKNKLAKTSETDDLRKKCKAYLDGHGVKYSEEILPFVEDDGITINKGCFVLSNDGNISLSYEKLVEYKQIDLIKRFFIDKIFPTDAISLDDINLFEISLMNWKNVPEELKKPHKEGMFSYTYIKYPSDNARRNDLNTILEELNPDRVNFFYFVKRLIENGATYKKQNGHGDDITIFDDVVDMSKTNFFYRVACDMLRKINFKKDWQDWKIICITINY